MYRLLARISPFILLLLTLYSCDFAPPEIVINKPKPGVDYINVLPVEVEVYDDKSVDNVEITLDGDRLPTSGKERITDEIDITDYGVGSFTFKVQAWDKAGNFDDASREVSLNVEIVSAPTISGPSSGYTGTPYSFTLSGASSSLEHDLEYFIDWGDGSSRDWDSGTSASYSWNNPGTYQVKAKARCASHTDVESDWSDSKSIIISEPRPSPPNLSSPSNGSTITDNTPTFDWSDPTYAYRYELILDNNSSFTSPEIHETNLSSSTYTPSSGLSNDTYYWKVRAKNSAGVWGNWSSTWIFTVNVPPVPSAPTLYSPSNGSTITGNTPTFDWSDPTYAYRYELIVDNNSYFTSPEIHETNLSSSTYTPSTSLSNDTYYWKVRAKNSTGDWGDWSSPFWNFTITGNIVVTEPTSSTVWTQGDQDVTISWDTGNLGGTVDIHLYKSTIQVATIATGTSNDGSHTLWDVPASQTPGTDYRVRVYYDASHYDYSDNFTIAGNIVVTEPTSSTVWTQGQQNVTISWDTGNLGGTVDIHLFKGSTQVATIATSTSNDGSHNTWDVPSKQMSGTDYRVRVYYDVSHYDYSDYFTIAADIVDIAVINPDSFRILKFGFLSGACPTPSYYSLASATVDDADYYDPSSWHGVGEHSDFIGTILSDAGYSVDYFSQAEYSSINPALYDIVIVQDPLENNYREFDKTVEDELPDLLEKTTSQLFINQLSNYFNIGGRITLVGDAVRLLGSSPGPGKYTLEFGKSIIIDNAENTLSEPSTCIPAKWLFIRGNPFCGVDRTGSGTYSVESSTFLLGGTKLSDISLFDGNDLPRSLTWSNTVYYPSDGTSLMNVRVQGSGDYVFADGTCSPPVYAVTVNDVLSHFMGYTIHDGKKIFYIGADSYYNYKFIDYHGTWHAGETLEIEHTLTPEGKQAILQLVDYVMQ